MPCVALKPLSGEEAAGAWGCGVFGPSGHQGNCPLSSQAAHNPASPHPGLMPREGPHWGPDAKVSLTSGGGLGRGELIRPRPPSPRLMSFGLQIAEWNE